MKFFSLIVSLLFLGHLLNSLIGYFIGPLSHLLKKDYEFDVGNQISQVLSFRRISIEDLMLDFKVGFQLLSLAN
jgi:hypothetical protein